MAPALLALRETSSSSAVIPFQRIALAWNVEVASCSHPVAGHAPSQRAARTR